ncbi:diguanylate cyclase [Subtercola sp. YIM 133946]|uniref:diguanylate cyclase n=1 Tax=Subtercola sp. YIM 133946 TaxID=3118909 RepID=UPI002F932019
MTATQGPGEPPAGAEEDAAATIAGDPLGPASGDPFERAPCGLLSTTPSGVVTTANETFLTMVGASHDEVVGHYVMERLTRGSKLFYETRLMPLLRSQGRVNEIALELQVPGADVLSVFVNAVVDRAAGHEAIRFAVFDATLRRHYERDLLAARRAAELSEKRVRILQSATTGFGAADTELDLATTLVDAARAATDASLVRVYFLDETGDLVPVTADTLPPIPPNAQSPVAETARTATTLLCPDSATLAARFPASVDDLHRERIESLAAVPILESGAATGVVVCGFGRPRQLEPNTVHLLESLAEQSVLVRQRIRLRQQVVFQSLHDALTGLPNRLFLQRRLDQALAAAQPGDRAIALVFIDLDGFKAINDKLGHRGGDLVLQQVSERLRGGVRGSDTVARLGGDEFLVVCEGVDEGSILDVAERLRLSIRRPLVGDAADLPLSASVGVSLYRADADRDDVTGETLIRLADEAMYESKRAGKDRYTFVEV